ncbi:MAG: hypothetical protein V4793_19655 [Paraburkholderia tropica]|uniref:hypothetical protein n=1 Tax=Paraburkholderia tropica TaxID=92647 RepID=UPI003100D6F6
MATRLDEQRTPEDRSEKAVDESVKNTFPASAPPAVGGATRIESASTGGPDGPLDDDEPAEGTPGEASPQTEKTGADQPDEGTEADGDEEAGSEAPPNESSPDNDR